MKNVFVKAMITAVASTLILTACGTNPSAFNGALDTDSETQFFSQLAADGTPEFAFGEVRSARKSKKELKDRQ